MGEQGFILRSFHQFTYKSPEMPVVMGTMKKSEWTGGASSGIQRRDTGGLGGRVIRRG